MSSTSSSSSSSMSFPIVVIAIVGILGTAAFLLIYYIFVIKCCLNIRISESDRILRRISRSRRRLQRHFSFSSAAPPVEFRHGLDPSAIRSIPTFRYSSADTPLVVECAVCLLEFREKERLRRLGGCGHAFHIDCIDTWLESNASCPLCRAEVTELEEESVVVEIGERWVGKVGSMGDECVEVGREKDERFVVQPMRRSLSMDSSAERKVLEGVQEALRRNPELLFREEGGGGGERRQRLVVAFGGWRSGRSSRTAVQPIEMEV